jgi:hypothetical protein
MAPHESGINGAGRTGSAGLEYNMIPIETIRALSRLPHAAAVPKGRA